MSRERLFGRVIFLTLVCCAIFKEKRLFADDWVSVSCGHFNTAALKKDGTLWIWGDGRYAGLGDTARKYTPTQLGNEKWGAVFCGPYHALALKKDGTLWAWGMNGSGRLGTGVIGEDDDHDERYVPDRVWISKNLKSVSCGREHTAALKKDGTLWIWGNNFYGQLGTGYTTNEFVPVPVGADNDWTAVSCGDWHTVAVKKDGTLWAWGYNEDGQLGLGAEITNAVLPTQVGKDNDWDNISCGYWHTAAIKKDGTLWIWGNNHWSQLGKENIENIYEPEMLNADKDWMSVSCGAAHTAALKKDGTLWIWGDNWTGQLGLGADAPRTAAAPSQIKCPK